MERAARPVPLYMMTIFGSFHVFCGHNLHYTNAKYTQRKNDREIEHIVLKNFALSQYTLHFLNELCTFLTKTCGIKKFALLQKTRRLLEK